MTEHPPPPLPPPPCNPLPFSLPAELLEEGRSMGGRGIHLVWTFPALKHCPPPLCLLLPTSPHLPSAKSLLTP